MTGVQSLEFQPENQAWKDGDGSDYSHSSHSSTHPGNHAAQLLCVRHCWGTGDKTLNKKDKNLCLPGVDMLEKDNQEKKLRKEFKVMGGVDLQVKEESQRSH